MKEIINDIKFIVDMDDYDVYFGSNKIIKANYSKIAKIFLKVAGRKNDAFELILNKRKEIENKVEDKVKFKIDFYSIMKTFSREKWLESNLLNSLQDKTLDLENVFEYCYYSYYNLKFQRDYLKKYHNFTMNEIIKLFDLEILLIDCRFVAFKYFHKDKRSIKEVLKECKECYNNWLEHSHK